MTAIRNFPDAPLRQRTKTPTPWRTPAFVIDAWLALQRIGQRRAARELQVLAQRHAPSDPGLAHQLRQAAADCRREAGAQPIQTAIERSPS